MKLTLRLLAGFTCLVLLLAGPPSHAQQPTAPAPPAAAADVLLLNNGQELSGRVLAISPTELTYQPTPVAGAAPAADTVRLPVASVFMVRYANGTREVLAQLRPAAPAAPPDPAASPLLGLSGLQRRQLGQHDARVNYWNSGPFWGSLAANLGSGPLFGLVPTIAIAHSPVKPTHLNAPRPALLTDLNYQMGYQQQAHVLKRRRTWGGYFVATGLYAVLIAAALSN